MTKRKAPKLTFQQYIAKFIVHEHGCGEGEKGEEWEKREKGKRGSDPV